MTAIQIEGVVSSGAATLDAWNNFLSDLLVITGPDGAKFDLHAAIPGTNPTVRTTVEKLLAQVNSLDEESAISSLDAAALVANTGAGEQLSISAVLVELQVFVQNLLITAQQVRTMVGLSGQGGLALELSHMQVARAAQRRALTDFRRLSKALEARGKELEGLVIVAREAAAKVTTAETAANEELVKVAEAKAKADTLIAAAGESEEAAKRAKETVDAYNKTFAAFQKDLDARNVAFEKGKTDLETFISSSQEKRDALLGDQTKRYNALSESILEKEKEIDGILKRSRAVLGEATVSGLSDSFAKEMTEASKQIWRMQMVFFASVIFIVIAAAIVLDVFPWIHVAKATAPATGDALSVAVYLLANFLRTLTFLLAPLLLLIYAAQRYVELFKMKTHYTYKYTVAASLPGFKLEAPKYAEEITAAAFQELLFNPGDSLNKPDEASDKKGSTILQRILEPMLRRAMEKMGEDPKP